MTGWYRYGLAGALLVQLGLLGWMIADRALLIRNGTEIRMPVIPVDPRDLVLGDYVTLTYTVSRLHSGRVAGDDDFFPGDTVYVSIAPDGDDWQATAMAHTPPDGGTFLRGTVAQAASVTAEDGDDCADTVGGCIAYDIDYNLERFYVPEGTGREIETLRNGERVSVDVAVAGDGRAALKRLLVDGDVRYEESLI